MARGSSISSPFKGKRIVPKPKIDSSSPFFGTVLYRIMGASDSFRNSKLWTNI
jgi:hypothetical protein